MSKLALYHVIKELHQLRSELCTTASFQSVQDALKKLKRVYADPKAIVSEITLATKLGEQVMKHLILLDKEECP
ncbi:hypothetical protein ACDJ35_03815 [Enterococcus faecalis]|uniref:hypothetical protein n=1 Tax=Enterococcus faecalis TaxID=1351 RepID=UPI003F643AE9